MANSGKVSLKLLVDKEKNRVVFAECDNDFVDILFSFLTLPLGTIIRKKPSSLGCFARLYGSIQNIGNKVFETEACKNMLLQPRSAAEVHCENLKINVNDLIPRRFYRCPGWRSRHWPDPCYSSFPGARCHCGKEMTDSYESVLIDLFEDDNYVLSVPLAKQTSDGGVFVEGGARRYIVADDFQVTEACTIHSLALLNKLGIRDGTILEIKDVEVGQEEVMNLLERSMRLKTPLSEVFLGSKEVTNNNVDINVKEARQIKVETDTHKDSNRIELKLFVNKDNGDVLYAEAGDDFINLFFSFLTFPLGSIVKLMDRGSCLGCTDNLYCTVEALSDIKSEECKNMLLDPKLPPFFGCSNQILKIDEMPPENSHTFSRGVVLSAMNPKLPVSGTNGGGRFVKESARFMVTGDLVVTQFSPVEAINLINRLDVPITNLEERMVFLGEAEVLNLLKASLISDNALNTAFSSKKRRYRRLLA